MSCGLATAASPRVILSGQVLAQNAQPVYCPPSNTSPVVLRYYVSEGKAVKKGEVIVRIDAGQSAAMIQTLTAQIEQTEARAAQEVATLAVTAIDAERAFIDADALHRKAQVDAAIPKQHLSALDHDRYQGELIRTERDLELSRKERDAAEAAVARRRDDARLEIDKLRQDLLYHQSQVAMAEVTGDVEGIVVHGLDDVGQDGMQLIRDVVQIYDNYGYETEVLAASIRHPMHIVDSALAGADVATIPFKVIRQLVQHPLTDKGLDAFLSDWKKSGRA